MWPNPHPSLQRTAAISSAAPAGLLPHPVQRRNVGLRDQRQPTRIKPRRVRHPARVQQQQVGEAAEIDLVQHLQVARTDRGIRPIGQATIRWQRLNRLL